MFGICFFMLKPPPQLFRSNVLATSSRREQAEKLFDRVRKAARITNCPLPSVRSHPQGNGRMDKPCPVFVRGLFADASGQNARLFCFRDKTQRSLTVIEIRPYRNGWKVFEAPGAELPARSDLLPELRAAAGNQAGIVFSQKSKL